MSGPGGIPRADFTWVWAGPFCTMQLAHLGAEVIRVESARRVCLLRHLPPWLEGKPGINRSGYFNQYNQGKRSIPLTYRPEAETLGSWSLLAISPRTRFGGVIERLGSATRH
jgi:crotonobetainyl-CoA:carnitine CoA-transferase CaiB-like acyl-CoA transferase